MEELYGQGNDQPLVYARAALIQENEGRSTLDPDLLVEAFRLMRRGAEPMGIVLVASSAAQALLLPLPPGMRLVAIVGEDAETPSSAVRFPVVTGIPGLLAAAIEGAIMVVDAERGRVWPDADAETIARLQTERHRPRFLLGAEHTAAATQAGRSIAVWAIAYYRSELEEALTEGADGVLVESFGDLLPDEWSDNPAEDFRLVLDAFGGGNIVLRLNAQQMDFRAAVRLAAHGELRLAFDPETLPLSLENLRGELNALVFVERDDSRRAELPRLVAYVSDLTSPDLPAFDEVILSSPDALIDAPLDILFTLPPFYVQLSDNLESLPLALGSGAAGVLVPAHQVAEVKELIRGLE